ncbi:MAG: SOS response-associated peptidase [Alphaproteobacteria bacterium]
MCGRYSITTPIGAMQRLFEFPELPNLIPRWNVAPTQGVPAVRIRPDGRGRELAILTWGLVPSWAEDPKIAYRMINARAETVREKPAFRHAFRRRRCLLPADGFYEWTPAPGGRGKQPWRIGLPGDAPFAFAGLWEQWMGKDGSEIESCTIVTVEAAPAIAHIHTRMPAILEPGSYAVWLAGEPDAAAALMRPYAGELAARAVSMRVNDVRNDDPSLLDPPAAAPTAARPPQQLDLL